MTEDCLPLEQLFPHGPGTQATSSPCSLPTEGRFLRALGPRVRSLRPAGSELHVLGQEVLSGIPRKTKAVPGRKPSKRGHPWSLGDVE